MLNKQMLIIIPTLVLAACESEEEAPYRTYSLYNSTDYSMITGQYRADITADSGRVDENIIYIAPTGFFKAYNFTGDQVDEGPHCYAPATGNQVNAAYMNKRLEYDENTRQFYVYPDRTDGWENTDLRWEFDAAGALSQVYIDGDGTNLAMTVQDVDGTFKAAISTQKISDKELEVHDLCP